MAPERDGPEAALLEALGHEIRYWRMRRKMSRAELAAAVGISETTMGRAERDGPADVGDTWKIANALGISFPDLVRRAEEAVGLSAAEPSLGVAKKGDVEEPGEFE
jgi:DNA-binding XRE family transcriptional regulator